jgi:hypothetical protein
MDRRARPFDLQCDEELAPCFQKSLHPRQNGVRHHIQRVDGDLEVELLLRVDENNRNLLSLSGWYLELASIHVIRDVATSRFRQVIDHATNLLSSVLHGQHAAQGARNVLRRAKLTDLPWLAGRESRREVSKGFRSRSISSSLFGWGCTSRDRERHRASSSICFTVKSEITRAGSLQFPGSYSPLRRIWLCDRADPKEPWAPLVGRQELSFVPRRTPLLETQFV